jgi:radical SAM protein with 4Fe4S-binding SPASM domain
VNYHRFNAPLQKCSAGNKIVHLEPNGDIYPCHLLANLPKETFLMGNLLKDSTKEISARLNDFALRTSEAIAEYKSIDECKKCRVSKDCGGGCIAEIVSVGQLIEPQLICKKIKSKPPQPLFKPDESLLPLASADSGDLSKNEREQIATYISQNLRNGHDLAHGLDHVNCVVEYARYIAVVEHANLRVVTAAAYFHDFEPRRKLIYEAHTEYSAQQAASFLNKLNFTESEVAQVYQCIISSSYGAHELVVSLFL